MKGTHMFEDDKHRPERTDKERADEAAESEKSA
jgi:hypothetical protein